MIAVIPCKTFSERIPGKNLKLLNGRPLVDYTIQAALSSGMFDTIWVTSDSYDFLKLLPKDVDGHLRPDGLSTPTSTVVDVVKDLLGVYTTTERHNFGSLPESFAVLLCSSPLRTVDDIQQAVKLYERSDTESVMSVVEMSEHPEHALKICEKGKLHPCSWATIDQKRQSFDKKYIHDGSIIICNTAAFLGVDDFYDLDTVPIETPRERAVDINVMADWNYCEYLMGEQ